MLVTILNIRYAWRDNHISSCMIVDHESIKNPSSTPLDSSYWLIYFIQYDCCNKSCTIRAPAHCIQHLQFPHSSFFSNSYPATDYTTTLACSAHILPLDILLSGNFLILSSFWWSPIRYHQVKTSSFFIQFLIPSSGFSLNSLIRNQSGPPPFPTRL